MWMDRRVFSKYKFEISSLKRKMLGKKKKFHGSGSLSEAISIRHAEH